MTAPAPVPDGTTPPASWRCRRGWHGRSEIGLQGLAVLCIAHRCPRCGTVWREQVTPMSTIDPPSEGQAPRAASAGRVQPPPGLLDKVAEALISEGGGPGDSLHSWRCEYPDIYGPCDCVAETVRELWDAVAEGLGLREALIFGGRRHLVSDPLEPQP